MAKKPLKTGLNPVAGTPSEPLVNVLLKRLDYAPADDSISEQWKQLEKKQPNVAFFIMTCSYRAAPDDPEARAAIAANMLYLYILLGEAQLHEEISRNLGGSLDGYFS